MVVHRFLLAVLISMTAPGCGAPAQQPGAPPPAPQPQPQPQPGPRGEPQLRPQPPPPAGTAAVRLPPPISGGTLLVLRDGRTAVVSDPDRDRISVVDLGARKLRGQLVLEPGAEPGRIVEDGEGRAHVVLRGAGAVLTVDPLAVRTLSRRTLCAAPRGLAFDRVRGLLHVACAGGELVSVGALAETPDRTLQLDLDLRDVLVQGDQLLVSTFRKAELLVVSARGIGERLAPPRMPAAFAGGGRDAPPSPPRVPGGPDVPMASPSVAWRLLPAPGGHVLMLHQRGAVGEVGTEPAAYGGGPGCAGVVEVAVSQFDTSGSRGAVQSSGALAGAVLAVDMALSPDGRWLAVVSAAHAGTDRQLLFYPAPEVPVPPTGRPCVPGVAVMPPAATPAAPGAGSEALAPPVDYRPPSGEVIAVAFDGAGNVLAQSREPATLQLLTQRAEPIVLSLESRADRGHQLFHAATSGQMACASCHPEGGEDGRVWRFQGLGPRRTQSLRGGIMDTAPFHWSGELTSFAHLMADVFQGRMGGGPIDRAQREALERWIDRLPIVQPSRRREDPAAVRGKVIFHDPAVGCAVCHGGSDFTNGGSFDVGTGGTFQVPQLHGLALRAPYLHDGCASTLDERFTRCGGGDRHGLTATLNPADVADLVAFLETL
jgi:hypothetical protein